MSPISMLNRAAGSLLAGVVLLALGACVQVRDGATARTDAPSPDKPRLLVLTDIGGDPDDQQSMVRLLMYANEFDVEGVVTTSAGIPGQLDQPVVRPDLVLQLVDAYEAILPNLRLHDRSYPAAADLRARIRPGNPLRGLEHIGSGHDTDGSRWIIEVVDRDDPRPLNIVIWGGQSDLAQALWRVRNDRGVEGLRHFVSRMRVYDIGDQDGIADWLLDEFPGMFYVLSAPPEGAGRRDAAYRGMYLGGRDELTSLEWIEEHVRTEHGPLGALYPPRTHTAPNPHRALKEGDTPSWFYFLPTGLGDPDHPEWGGWGGRFEPAGGARYRDASDSVEGTTHVRATVWRWRPSFQADFQARMDWAVRDYSSANHPPEARLRGEAWRSVRPGQHVELDASASSDPDGDAVSYRWFVYPEAGTYGGDLALDGADSPRAILVAPSVGAPSTVHVILEVTDEGLPRLTRYRRVVLEVRP